MTPRHCSSLVKQIGSNSRALSKFGISSTVAVSVRPDRVGGASGNGIAYPYRVEGQGGEAGSALRSRGSSGPSGASRTGCLYQDGA